MTKCDHFTLSDRYLLLFYNNAGNSFGQRNPYWLACGIEAAGSGILWSQPEIVIYDRYNHGDRPGYPDFIQSMLYYTLGLGLIARI